jgi:2,4-dienoyl-CoA reductase-like NADH-dependent reductase (Old Yellow Enzyme family)
MSILFKPYRIGELKVRNRFMRSATTSYYSDERGVIKPVIVDLYRDLALGGVGLIVKGHLYILDEGKAHTGMAGISHDYHVSGLQDLTNAVHESGGKIVAQLNHGGYNSMVDRAGPSEYEGERSSARALDVDEIKEIVDAFGVAAGRAVDAGFDGVQIHGAHGYLISQFLSRLANRRGDNYGGSLENRMRLLQEVYDEVRAQLGGYIPIMLKINCDDFSPGGFNVDDCSNVVKSMRARGLNLLELSGGGFAQRTELRNRARSKNIGLEEADFAGHAEKLMDVIRPTVFALVSGIRSMRTMEKLVKEKTVDMISMSRPFIREPDLVKKFEEGQQHAICISCGACSGRDVFGKTMLRCHIDRN